MNDFAHFIGFFTAHMVWMLADGDNAVPLIAIQKANERWFDRVPDETSYERAVATARERLQAMRLGSDCFLLAYDGFLTWNNKRYESLIIDAAESRDPDETAFCLAIPYRSARSENGLAIYSPKVIKTNSLNTDIFLDNLFEGIYSHTKASEFWNTHMDNSE